MGKACLIMSVSAFIEPSGGYPAIAARTRSPYVSDTDHLRLLNTAAAGQQGTSPSESNDRWPWPLVGFAVTCGVIGLATVGPWLVLLADEESHRVVRSLLLLVACISLTLCGAAVMNVLRVRADDRRADRLQAAIDIRLQAVKASLIRRFDGSPPADAGRADVAEALDRLGDKLGEQVDQVGGTVMIEAAQLREVIREVVGGRLAELERRIEERDEEYEQGWVHGSAHTAEALAPNGTVHQLRSAAPPRGRRTP